MRIKVNGKRAEIIERSNPLTVGQKGEQISIEFSADWDGLTKTAQFYNGESTVNVLMTTSDTVTIPAEMAVSKRPVSVCFIGKNDDGTVVFPAVECAIGSVWYGERPGGEPPVPPTPDWKAQIEASLNGKLDKAPISMATNADTQEVHRKPDGSLWTKPGGGSGGGAVDSINGKTGDVTLTAEDVHALPDTTEIPNVPDWAMAPQKPTYTAEDVGALPSTTEIPTKLPNPKQLTFTGAATATYDGSEPVTVNIPSVGAADYGSLTGKPQINGHELAGNQTGTELGIVQEVLKALPTWTWEAV